MRTITVGTTAVEVFHPNAKRVRFSIQMTPSSIATGNTGIVFIGRGFNPVPTVGDANQGDVMRQGAAIEEKKSYDGDTLPYKGKIVAISDTAAQQLTVDEQLQGD